MPLLYSPPSLTALGLLTAVVLVASQMVVRAGSLREPWTALLH